MKQNLKAIKDQKKKMKEYDDRRQEVLDKQKALLDQHRAELDRRSEELKRLHEKYDKNMALMKASLHKSEERHEETKNSLAVVSAKTASTPRAIHTHPSFQSLVDSEAHATPSKRQRSSLNDEKVTTISESSPLSTSFDLSTITTSETSEHKQP